MCPYARARAHTHTHTHTHTKGRGEYRERWSQTKGGWRCGEVVEINKKEKECAYIVDFREFV